MSNRHACYPNLHVLRCTTLGWEIPAFGRHMGWPYQLIGRRRLRLVSLARKGVLVGEPLPAEPVRRDSIKADNAALDMSNSPQEPA